MCIANPSKNPRPNRIINLLTQKGYSVDTIAYKSDGNLNIFNENILEELSLNKKEKIKRLFLKVLRLFIPNLSVKIKITEKIYNLDKIKIDLNCYDLVVVEFGKNPH